MKRILILLTAVLAATVTYSQPGTIDNSFGDKGFVYTKALSAHYAITQQKDGKLLTAGGYIDPDGNIARFLPDGTLDSSFGNSGFAYGGGAYDMILQPDEKILIIGATLDENGKTRSFVARYQPGGTPDSSFGENGMTLTPDFKDYSGYNRLELELDGSIIIAGAGTTEPQAVAFEYMMLSRLTADGMFDYNFGTNGRVLQTIPTYYTVNVGALAIQEDGKILLGGFAERGGYDQQDYVLCRYRMDGTLDESFGINGIVVTQGVEGLSGHDAPYGIVVQPDGKIVLGGTTAGYDFITYMAAIRYEANGTLDKSFGIDGRALVSFEGKVPKTGAILMQPNGKLILAGQAFDNLTSEFALCRLNKDGSLDSSFAVNGKQLTAFSGGGVEIRTCATLQQDGKIVQGGSYYNDKKGYSNYLMVRYNGDREQPNIIARIKRWLKKHGIGWQGLDSKNISYYSIQYSKTGNHFVEKGKVSGIGNSALRQYNFSVEDAGYYRVVGVDKKGYKTFSNKVLLNPEDLGSNASIYPNPVRDYVSVQGLKNNEQANITIINGNGTILAKGVSNGSTQYRVPAARLHPGTYYLNITSEGNTETLKFVKE